MVKRLSANIQQEYIKHLGDGLIATDGLVFSAIATVGTTAVEVLNKLIDPGYNMVLTEFEVGLNQRFIGLNGSLMGSINYYWEARPEYVNAQGTKVTGDYINLCGTLSKGVGTLITLDDTLSGYVPVGSIPAAPVRIRLTAKATLPAIVTGKVKNSSYIRMQGIVIPGT